MIAEDEDRAIARLRDELGSVRLTSSGDQVDRVLRHVHGRRRVQRHQRVQMLTAVAVVVFAVAGAFVVTSQSGTGPDRDGTAAAAVTQWQLRGDLAGETDLVNRAEQTWRTSATPPAGAVRAVFAGRSPNITACLDIVVLVADVAGGKEQVAFVTTPVSVTGKPDRSKLLLRALTTVPDGQRAVGFLSATPAREDEPTSSGGPVGLALTAPGVAEIEVRTSALDDQAVQTNTPAGAVWPAFEQGAGAWNAELVVRTPGDHKQRYPIAAGLADPAVDQVALRTEGGVLRASGPGLRQGDLIATPDGVVGVVNDPNGTVDTRLSALAAVGRVQTSVSAVPGQLVDGSGGVGFQPTAAGRLEEGNRLVLLAWDQPRISLNIGTLRRSTRGWLTDRVAGVVAATSAMRVGGP
ncbi:hypothetical protein JOD54_000599 [Actinokineospora baliensis]|uniref:hypothetical protein n=1 Tax=Actinokineospora baliensis TaxID=547056 RepID=UPI00195C2532|nr:hypothetical protein [Actinokineospora baliensis]MBM7770395.1 hypothetical protein [Actinokineospora baliensis]